MTHLEKINYGALTTNDKVKLANYLDEDDMSTLGILEVGNSCLWREPIFGDTILIIPGRSEKFNLTTETAVE